MLQSADASKAGFIEDSRWPSEDVVYVWGVLYLLSMFVSSSIIVHNILNTPETEIFERVQPSKIFHHQSCCCTILTQNIFLVFYQWSAALKINRKRPQIKLGQLELIKCNYIVQGVPINCNYLHFVLAILCDTLGPSSCSYDDSCEPSDTAPGDSHRRHWTQNVRPEGYYICLSS